MSESIVIKRPGVLRVYWFLCMFMTLGGLSLVLSGTYLVVTRNDSGVAADLVLKMLFGVVLIFFGSAVLIVNLIAFALPRNPGAWKYHFAVIVIDLIVLILTLWPAAILVAFLIGPWQRPETRGFFDPERFLRRRREDWDDDWDRKRYRERFRRDGSNEE